MQSGATIGYEPIANIRFMVTRNRPTELARETGRRAATVAIELGRQVRLARRRLPVTQAVLGSRIGVSQTEISRIERGLGAHTSLATWIALGIALERPLAVQLSRPLGEERGLVAAGHLEIQEHVLGRARATGRHGTFELPTRPIDPTRSTDVGIRDPRHRLRILVECWNSFGDLGAAVRSTHRKAAESAAAWPDDRTATVWVVRASATNRRLLAEHPNIVDAAFPGSSRLWVAALDTGAIAPDAPGIVWFDPGTGRLIEHRRYDPATSGRLTRRRRVTIGG